MEKTATTSSTVREAKSGGENIVYNVISWSDLIWELISIKQFSFLVTIDQRLEKEEELKY